MVRISTKKCIVNEISLWRSNNKIKNRKILSTTDLNFSNGDFDIGRKEMVKIEKIKQ